MPNNFRLTGTRYVSKAGHDSNDGLTKDTPKKTITSLNGLIVGTGVYPYTNIYGGIANYSIEGDGDVYITGDLVSQNTGATMYFTNVKHTGAFGGLSNTAFRSINSIHNGTLTKQLYCNMRCTNSVFIQYLLSSIYPNTGAGSDPVVYFKSSIFIESAIRLAAGSSNSFYVRDCYFDTMCIIYNDHPTTPILPTSFKNNNVRCVMLFGTKKYAIQDLLTGTPLDNGYSSDVYWLNEANLTANGYTGTIAGWDAAVATCINRDPKFNDASKLDFTLKADSPHIGRASNGVSNIGGTEYAQSFYAGSSSPNILLLQPSSEIDTTNNTDWKLYSGQTQGTIRAIIKVANTNEVIFKIPYIGNKTFNSDTTPGTSTNFNVPDSKPTSSGYPSYLNTTSLAPDAYRVVIVNHGFLSGVWLKVDGQYREVTSVTANELIFLTAVRAAVSGGTSVQVGSLTSLTSLNPNRLGFKMRSSILSDVNSSNWDNAATWDNNSLADAGAYLEQEWDRQPMIDNLNKVGFGDDLYDSNYGNPIQVKYIDLLIYLRNDYKS